MGAAAGNLAGEGGQFPGQDVIIGGELVDVAVTGILDYIQMGGRIVLPDLLAVLQGDQAVAVAVRPENLVLGPRAPNGAAPCGEIVELAFRGDTTLASVRLPSGFVARATRANAFDAGGYALSRGDAVYLSFDATAARVLAS